MKRIISVSAFILLLCATLAAQEKPSTLKFYGFIRNYFAFDTRESVAGTEDFFYYVPKDQNIVDGEDLNAHPGFRFAALTSRLGLDILGYEYDGFKVGGKIEGDFYSGVSGVTGTAQFRLRQAYATIGKGGWQVTGGQTWHPMATDMPDVFSLNTGAPFGPFSRTPLLKFDLNLTNSLSLTAAAIWQMQYTSAGPEGASANYIKYGMTPEAYLGLNLKVGDFTANTPFLFLQYKSGLFSAKLKSVFAQAGEHVNLNGGYGVCEIKEDGSYRYTPTQNSSTWVSLMYGKKTQAILFGGFVKNFGTIEQLEGFSNGYAPASYLYFSKNSFSNMNAMWRVTPTIIQNIGKFSIGLEYELTSVQYGDYKTINGVKYLGNWGLAEDNLHWITNHRVQALMKFSF